MIRVGSQVDLIVPWRADLDALDVGDERVGVGEKGNRAAIGETAVRQARARSREIARRKGVEIGNDDLLRFTRNHRFSSGRLGEKNMSRAARIQPTDRADTE